MRSTAWRRSRWLLVSCSLLMACGQSIEPSIEASTDSEPSPSENVEVEYSDPVDTAPPSTTPLELGQVGERPCGPGAACAAEFVLDGTVYGLSCEAVREDAVLPEELGQGHAFAQNVVVHPVQGFEIDEVVAINIPGGYCAETDPDEVHTPWSMALGYLPSRGGEGGRGPRVTGGRAACQIGALSPLRAEANGCPGNSQTSDVVEILTAAADDQSGMQALNTFTLHHDRGLNCLYHDEPDNNGEPGTGGRVAIVWPFGYTAVANETGVSVLDATGRPVAHTDVTFQIGGGSVPAQTEYCDVIGVWVANGPPLTP